MNEARFWICLWALALVGFITLASCITVGAMQANSLYYKAQSECIAKGASWIPARGDGICMGGK